MLNKLKGLLRKLRENQISRVVETVTLRPDPNCFYIIRLSPDCTPAEFDAVRQAMQHLPNGMLVDARSIRVVEIG